MWIGEHESAQFGLTVLTEFKGRGGVQNILAMAMDNLMGFSDHQADSPRLETSMLRASKGSGETPIYL